MQELSRPGSAGVHDDDRRSCAGRSCGRLEVCQHRRGRSVTIEIEHPAGEEIQWDWLELTAPPVGGPAFVLVCALSHSGRFRAVFCEHDVRALGGRAGTRCWSHWAGTPRVWRTDWMATIVNTRHRPVDEGRRADRQALRGAGRGLSATSRATQGRCRGRGIKYLTKSWWRTGGALSAACRKRTAGPGLRWCGRCRRPAPAPPSGRGAATVAVLAAAEPLRALHGLAYPAVIEGLSGPGVVVGTGRISRPTATALPSHAGAPLTVLARVGQPVLRILSSAARSWPSIAAPASAPGRPSARQNTPRCWSGRFGRVRRPSSLPVACTTATGRRRPGEVAALSRQRRAPPLSSAGRLRPAGHGAGAGAIDRPHRYEARAEIMPGEHDNAASTDAALADRALWRAGPVAMPDSSATQEPNVICPLRRLCEARQLAPPTDGAG